jgi:hypothetical protein
MFIFMWSALVFVEYSYFFTQVEATFASLCQAKLIPFLTGERDQQKRSDGKTCPRKTLSLS